jgi:hypothetical protein
MTVRTLVLILLLYAGNASRVDAQGRSNAFVDVSVGANTLVAPFTGDHYEAASLFAFLAFGNQPDANRSLLAAVHVGMLTFRMGGMDTCHLLPLGSNCRRHYPLGGVVAITVGGRPRTPLGRFAELTAGPAIVVPYQGATTVGLLTVGRIGLPPGRYLSPGLAFHGLITGVRGDVLFSTGVGLSLRTW